MKVDVSLCKGGFTLAAKAEWPDTDMTVIAGPSGAGKSSLLRALVGLERAQGHVEFKVETLQSANAFIPAHKRRMAWVSQHDDVFTHLSVRENLLFAMRHARPGGAELAVIVEQFSLNERLEQNAGALSGGQKQRLILARALLSNPCLLALDEPFGALDAEARHDLLGILLKFCARQGLSVLFVSHDLDTLSRLADFMIYLDNGKVVAQGALNTCLLDERLPYRHRDDACVVLKASAAGYETSDRLNVLRLGEAKIFTPGMAIPKGRTVRLRIRAGDISLSRTRYDDSSVLNILPVTIKHIEHVDGQNALSAGLVNVTLILGGMSLLARITEKSARMLRLSPGDQVFAQIKASTLAAGET